jgi:hypothetical protein
MESAARRNMCTYLVSLFLAAVRPVWPFDPVVAGLRVSRGGRLRLVDFLAFFAAASVGRPAASGGATAGLDASASVRPRSGAAAVDVAALRAGPAASPRDPPPDVPAQPPRRSPVHSTAVMTPALRLPTTRPPSGAAPGAGHHESE